MGGPGSGSWQRWAKKLTIEDGLSLDINKLVRHKLIVQAYAEGFWEWKNTRTGEVRASVNFLLEPQGEDGLIFRLSYSKSGRDGEKENFDYSIMLQATRPFYGGRRWWFTCPLVKNSWPCERRVGKLYLPPGGKYFGCRHCYDLTYRSSQEADSRFSKFFRNYDGSGGGENMPIYALKGCLNQAWKEKNRLKKQMNRRRRGRPPKGASEG